MNPMDLKTLCGPDGFYPDNIWDLIVGQDPERRRVDRAIKGIVVANSRYDAVFSLLQNTLVCAGGGRESDCFVICGPSGIGKSTVLDTFERQYGGPFKTKKGDLRPVLRVNTPPRPDLGSFYSAMLEKMGAGDLVSRNVNGMMSAVRAQLKIQQTRVLILDEFTHVVEDKTEYFTKKVVRELKGFISERVCDVVCVGTEKMIQIPDLYEQIQRRQGEGELVLLAFDYQNDEDRQEWLDWMADVGALLPIPPADPLNGQRVAKQFHFASNGLPNSVMKLLLLASLYAMEMGDDQLRQEHFWQGFESGGSLFARRLSDRKLDWTIRNPFDEPKTKRRRRVRVIQTDSAPDVSDASYLSGSPSKRNVSFSK
jgi:hypothetical protein